MDLRAAFKISKGFRRLSIVIGILIGIIATISFIIEGDPILNAVSFAIMGAIVGVTSAILFLVLVVLSRFIVLTVRWVKDGFSNPSS